MYNRWFRSSREQALARGVESTLLAKFRAWGYQEVDTPILEMSSAQGDGAFRILDQANQVVSLRPDFTRAIAKWVAANGWGQQRCSYYGNVFRRPEAGSEGLQVLRQAGVELLEAPSPWADVEVIALAIESLLALGFTRPQVAVSHSGFLRCLIRECGVGEAMAGRLLDALAHRDLVSFQQLVSQLGRLAAPLAGLPGICGDLSLLERAGELATTEPTRAALGELEATLRCLGDLGYRSYLQLNLSMVSQLDYYSGIRFEAYVSGAGGPVITGGRYDASLQAGAADCSATGFAVLVEQLGPVLSVDIIDKFIVDGPDYSLLPEPGAESVALRMADDLRRAGCQVEIHWGPHSPPEHALVGRKLLLVSKEGAANVQ